MQHALVLIAALAAMFSGTPVYAQEYPSRPVKILSPYPPGGVTDIASRLLAAKLTEAWKQQVVVENKVGGGGVVAMDALAKAAPDGYTLIASTVADYCIIPYAYAKLPYDVARDFVPVIVATETPLVWAAHRDAPFGSIRDLITTSKATPKGISYGTPGLGSLNHIVAEQVAMATGANLVHIPYKGGGPAGAALAGGEVPLGMLAVSSVAPHVRAGRVKALAVTSLKRNVLGPDWPTIAEAGVPGGEGSQWVGIAAPAGTPRGIVDRLNVEMNEALRAVDVKARLATFGSEPGGGTPEDMTVRMKKESEGFRAVIERLKLKLD